MANLYGAVENGESWGQAFHESSAVGGRPYLIFQPCVLTVTHTGYTCKVQDGRCHYAQVIDYIPLLVRRSKVV